jgi:hypothetical protein
VFIDINTEIVRKISKFYDNRLRGINAVKSKIGKTFEFLTDYPNDNSLIIIHTLSHALIRKISEYAGYSSASLRERIYFYINDHGDIETGILIYTSDSGAAGSLGGLAKLANQFTLEEIIDIMKEELAWCSHDPLCIDPILDQNNLPIDTDSFNIAACHSCLLIGETSCELNNQLLDRATLIGIPFSKSEKNIGVLHE